MNLQELIEIALDAFFDTAAERANNAARGRNSSQAQKHWTLGSADTTMVNSLGATSSGVRPAINSAPTEYQPRPQTEAYIEPTTRDMQDELAMAALDRLLAAEEFFSSVGDQDSMQFGQDTEVDHAIAVQIQLHDEFESRRESIAVSDLGHSLVWKRDVSLIIFIMLPERCSFCSPAAC